MNQSGSFRRHQNRSRTIPTEASSAPRPPLDTTGRADTGAAQRVVMLTAPSCREEQRKSEADDECRRPHVVDILAGKNRPMSRATNWCGWTTSSFEKFPAVYSCTWSECKCGQSGDTKSEKEQIETFNQMRRAQAMWSALDCLALTKANTPTPDQQHHYGTPPHHCARKTTCGAK